MTELPGHNQARRAIQGAIENLQFRIPGQVEPITVILRQQVINLLVGGVEPSYSFDRAGRLFGAFVGGRNYRRGLDNRVLEKWSEPGHGRQQRWLTPAEAESFVTAAYRLAGEARGRPELAVLQGWDWSALQADAARFRQVYKPVSILPPDQYLSLVLQATEGCSYNRCTFCDFYRDRAFRIKGPDELRAHIAGVLDFFGPALGLRKSLFLADANALVAPMPRLRAWFDVIAETPALPKAGIYSFIDAFNVGRKSLADWAELAGRGLKRVYIGLESGDDVLLRWLRKPGTAGDAIAAVNQLRAAGVRASVIVMMGVGGEQYAAAHVAGTVAALNAMGLAAGDIIYFSPYVDQPGSEYGRLAAEAGIRPLSQGEIADQEAAIRAEFRPADLSYSPQLSRYDIRQFIY
jgi:hypothetical protein